MAKYSITMERQLRYKGLIEIEAETATAAEEKALQAADRGEIVWRSPATGWEEKFNIIKGEEA